MTDEPEEDDPDQDAGDEDDGSPTPSAKERAAREEAEWTPPREVILLLAGATALACAALVFVGTLNKWTAPTLGVIFAVGLVEALVGVVLAVLVAVAEHRRKGLYVSGIAVTALGSFALVGVLILGGAL